MQSVVVLMDRPFSPESLRERVPLDLRNIGDSAWRRVISSCETPELRLYHLSIGSLDGIEQLGTTVRLEITWANKISNIAPIGRMSWLESLSLSDFPKLRSVEGIQALQGLRELHLSGNLGSLNPPLRLNSVKPIAKLANLEKLSLRNMLLEDLDISFLASFPHLRELRLSNKFERTQFAFLAKRLNSQLIEPIEASLKLKIFCKRCGEPLHLFTGRRMPVLCQACERNKFDKLTAQFDQLVRSS